jgi:hypothetical protein
MWTTARVAAGSIKLWTRSGRAAAASSRWTWSLENWLSANYSALRASTLRRSSALTLELCTRLSLRRWHGRARRRGSVNRARTRLRRNHAALRDNGLPWSWLRCRCRLGRDWCCRFCARRWRRSNRRSFRRRDDDCRRLCRRRWRDYGRWRSSSWLLDFLCRRRRWRRDNRGRLSRSRHNQGPFCRLDSWLFRRRRGRSNRRGCRPNRCSRSCCFHHCCRSRGRRWVLLFLLPLLEQLHYVARL